MIMEFDRWFEGGQLCVKLRENDPWKTKATEQSRHRKQQGGPWMK